MALPPPWPRHARSPRSWPILGPRSAILRHYRLGPRSAILGHYRLGPLSAILGHYRLGPRSAITVSVHGQPGATVGNAAHSRWPMLGPCSLTVSRSWPCALSRCRAQSPAPQSVMPGRQGLGGPAPILAAALYVQGGCAGHSMARTHGSGSSPSESSESGRAAHPQLRRRRLRRRPCLVLEPRRSERAFPVRVECAHACMVGCVSASTPNPSRVRVERDSELEPLTAAQHAKAPVPSA